MTAPRSFFLNAFPPHDRGLPADLTADIDRILSEAEGGVFEHTLFTVGTKRLDPFTLAQFLVGKSRALSPLIAVNPIHQHPLSVAKKLATISELYPQRLAVNLISGSFFREHKALADGTEYSEKSSRLLDFTLSLRKILSAGGPVYHDGEHYPLKGLEVAPKVSRADVRYFISGPRPPELESFSDTFFVRSLRPLASTEKLPTRSGFLTGICARKTTEEARAALKELFPADEFGRRMHEMSLSSELSPWNQFLRDYGKLHPDDDHYHLGPLENFWSPAPYIVGSYDEVASVLRAYEDLGAAFFIVDFHPQDFSHVREVIRIFRGPRQTG